MSNKGEVGAESDPLADEAGLLTTKELADYLRLNERTILKLAAQGELPAARLGNQWRFRRNVIDAWLDDQMLGVRRHWSEHAGAAASTFAFRESFRVEHVIENLQGNTISRVLAEMCAKAQELDLIVDRTWFLGALLERENLLPSAVGDGVAFPHTLDRHPEHVKAPFMIVGRSKSGVDFSASDGKRVFFVVLLGLRYQELHLPWLNRLSRLLRDSRVQKDLNAAVGASQFHQALASYVEAQDTD